MITLTCDQCGQEFQTKRYRKDLTEHHFCDKDCYGLWQRKHRIGTGRKRITVQCAQCGASLELQPCQVADHNFCDRQCYAGWRKGRFVGPESPNWQGGHFDSRGSNWDDQREKSLERDGHTCQHCGSCDNLSVHHKKPFHLFKTYKQANRLDNLTTLCNVCHGIAEQAFYREHPDLMGDRCLPIVRQSKTCRKCGAEFWPRSPRSQVCDACCTYTCAHCGKEFYVRRVGRSPKYCSRDCFLAAVKTH